MVRRVAAVGIGVVVVLLLVFGINGCLQGRKEQSLKNYNRDVSTIVRDADANADAFFETLVDRRQLAASTDVQSEINQLRFRAQNLTKRAEGLDVPGEMRPAQRNLLLSLSLIQESMGKVAEKLPAALSKDSATAVPAVKGIAGEMQAFTAADVVYSRRTAALIKQVLDENSIGGQVIQSSSFLQNLGWLQPSTVAKRISSEAGRGAGDGGATEPAPGTHGHGLISLSIGDQTLRPASVEHADRDVEPDVQREDRQPGRQPRDRRARAGPDSRRRRADHGPGGRRPDAVEDRDDGRRSSSTSRCRSARRSRSRPRCCRSTARSRRRTTRRATPRCSAAADGRPGAG